MTKTKFSAIVFSVVQCVVICGSIPPPPITEKIEVSKCCGSFEYMSDYSRCNKVDHGMSAWKPTFADPMGKEQFPGPSRFKYGIPVCQSREPWPVFNYTGSCDKLILLPDGKLRHYVLESDNQMESCTGELGDENLFQDYNTTEYCLDETIHSINNSSEVRQIAMICIPRNEFPWGDINMVMKKIINPIFHFISVACLLVVAVVYVVLPQLFDLVGNIITTMALCLIFMQVSDVVRIFVEYHSDKSYLVSDAVLHISSLGTFVWLNSLGYYIWKTFRSRNVFLRVTDGRKYCCYSVYAWGVTFSMGAMALFAHLVLDTNSVQQETKSTTEAAAIAELGVAVFLTTILCMIFVNLFFCLSTAQMISRMSTHGRIHHKLKYSFQLFVKLFIIITLNWFFYLLSWFPVNGLFYVHVFVNLFQAYAILYSTVLSVKKVRFLLGKACCQEKCVFPCCRPGDPGEVNEWGEEMMAMNIRN